MANYDTHTQGKPQSLRQKVSSLSKELERVTQDVELLKVKEIVKDSLSVGESSSSKKNNNRKKKDTNKKYNTAISMRLELLQELQRRTTRKEKHAVIESPKMVEAIKLKVLENNEERRQQMEEALLASRRKVVTVVGGGKARAQFHISPEVDFESLLDDVCILWGDLESSEYRLVANYALSVGYFEKGLYEPSDKVYET